MTLEQYIEDFAEIRGLTAGITTAEPFLELYEPLQAKNKALQGFAEQDIAKRIYPRKTMAEAKSIVVLAMGYGFQRGKTGDCLSGEISIGAVGTDYHVLLGKHLTDLAKALEEQQPDCKILSFVDTGPLVDRAVAVRAGLGYLGKNGCVHTAKFGSLAFFGYLLTNIPLQEKKRIEGDCGRCERCIQSCPTGALTKEMFHMKKCISYLTQTKTALPPEVMKTMGKQLYGCDICQVSCPKNKAYLESCPQGETSFSLEEILHCSNKAFQKNFGNTAAGWRGKKILQRNAVIALGNSHTEQALPLLAEVLTDTRPLLRQTAMRALVCLSKKEGIPLLEQAEPRETVTEILLEIQKSKAQLRGD